MRYPAIELTLDGLLEMTSAIPPLLFDLVSPLVARYPST
jgi:hypothetical protein